MHTETLFNGSLETSIRLIALLEALYPRSLDLETLTTLDYFVVHTGDLNGPESLHAEVATRFGSQEKRQTELQTALDNLCRMNLVSSVDDSENAEFVSGDDAPAFIKLLYTDYNRDLIERATWLAQQVTEEGETLLRTMRSMLDDWRQKGSNEETVFAI